MLSIAKVGRGRQAYYLATVPTGRDHDGGLVEAPGQWLGSAAAEAGLDGAVEAAALDALLRGADPRTGEILSPTHARVRVAGFDCTFSTPKSVSLLHALGPSEAAAEVQEAHLDAVRGALGYLERTAAYCRRSGSSGRISAPAQGLAAAGFLHRASRAPDPHLHTHVLVANCVPGPDGRWSALDGRGLFLQAGTASHCYEAHLRRGICERLGLRFGQMRGGSADLSGFDTALLREFSQRSAAIEDYLGERGYWGPRARRVAALATRPAKNLSVSYEEMQAGWAVRAAAHGLAVGRLGRLVDAGRSRLTSLEPPAVLDAAAVARLLGADGLTARSASFTRRDVLRALCRAAPDGVRVEGLERQASCVLASPLVLSRADVRPSLRTRIGGSIPAPDREIRYTTSEILALEVSLASCAIGRAGGAVALAPAVSVAGAVEERRALDAAARSAVARLALDGRGVEVVALTGVAPSGGGAPATDVLEAARAAWTSAGVPVRGVGAGLASARRLEAVSGIESVAVDALGRDCVSLRRSVAAMRGGVLVLGGADRIDPRRLMAILEGADAGGSKVVLVADRPLDRSPPLAAIAESVDARPAPALPAPLPARPASLVEWGELGGVRVGLAPSAEAAREAALAVCRARAAEGTPAILVAPDRATVRTLAAVSTGVEVVTPRQLAPALERSPGACLVTIGAAATLPAAIRRRAGVERVHVVASDAPREGVDRVGRMAEVAQPPKLVRSIGVPPRTAEGREAWRRTAVLALECEASVALGLDADGLADLRLAASVRELNSLRRGRSHERGIER